MPCVAREDSLGIASFTETPVYRGAISAQQQIRPVTLGLLQSGSAAPIGNFRVIAANQNLGHLPAAKIGWPRVMRKIQKGTGLDSGSIASRDLAYPALRSSFEMPHLAE